MTDNAKWDAIKQAYSDCKDCGGNGRLRGRSHELVVGCSTCRKRWLAEVKAELKARLIEVVLLNRT